MSTLRILGPVILCAGSVALGLLCAHLQASGQPTWVFFLCLALGVTALTLICTPLVIALTT